MCVRADVFGRFIAQRLQESLGQNFIIDNRPGGGSLIGTDAVAKSAPDGYTLLLMSNTHTVNESLIPSRPFQLMRDFAPIAPINASELVLVVKAGLPVNTLAELIRVAKAKPGGMSYASSGPGTMTDDHRPWTVVRLSSSSRRTLRRVSSVPSPSVTRRKNN